VSSGRKGRGIDEDRPAKLHGLHFDLPNFVKQRPLRRDVKCKQLITICIFFVLPVMMMDSALLLRILVVLGSILAQNSMRLTQFYRGCFLCTQFAKLK
jgi:hypothetical protein